MKLRTPLPNVRKLFLTDPGYIQFEADLKGADAQVVAWEAEDEMLMQLFRSGLDVHAQNAEDMFGTKFSQADKPSKKFLRKQCKLGVHLCLTEDHEVLTPLGWKAITDRPETIMCWSIDTQHLSFEKVVSWYQSNTRTEFYDFDDFSFSQKVTKDHKLPYQTVARRYSSSAVQYIPKSARLPKAGFWFKQNSKYSSSFIKLLCAFQADGSRSNSKIHFHLKKSRKILRLHQILRELAITFNFVEYKDGTTNTSFNYPDIPKVLDSYIFGWSLENIAVYVDEAKFWDGSLDESYCHRRETLTSKHKAHIEWFQTMCHLCGKASQRFDTANGCFGTSINNRPHWRFRAPKITNETLNVICPTTKTGFFMVKRNGVISITGNTNYGGTPPTLAQSLNWTRSEAEDFQRRWFDLHPGVRDNFHRKVRESLERNRTVTNRFGFRIVYFDRIDNVFTEALAWIPQSTVALVTYYAGLQLEQRFWPHHQVPNYVPPADDFAGLLLQTHDSLNFQFLLATLPPLRDIVRSLAIPIPYASPLTIPWELKRSTVSWGAMEPVPENEYA